MGRGMYALTSRPSKIVPNARIGPSKTLNNLETRDNDRQLATVGMSSPKPVFNGRGRLNNNVRPNSGAQQPSYPAQHEEIVKYLSDAWHRVSYELERNQKDGMYLGGPVVYREKNPNPRLHEFKAFDLEQYWGTRFLQQVQREAST